MVDSDLCQQHASTLCLRSAGDAQVDAQAQKPLLTGHNKLHKGGLWKPRVSLLAQLGKRGTESEANLS